MSRAQAVRELLRRMLDRIEAKGKLKIEPMRAPDLDLPALPPEAEPRDDLADLLAEPAQ